jgi:hypothetical protein
MANRQHGFVDVSASGEIYSGPVNFRMARAGIKSGLNWFTVRESFRPDLEPSCARPHSLLKATIRQRPAIFSTSKR